MVIDLWNEDAFDDETRNVLHEHSDLICNYVETRNQIFREYDDYSGPNRAMFRPSNPFEKCFYALKERLSLHMQSQTIRAWHYTRMTDEDVKGMLKDGIHLSTPETLKQRIDRLVHAGTLTEQTAENLIAASPFQSEQKATRTGRFWMVSHPKPIKHGGVIFLLKYWGGEVASIHAGDPALLETLENIGFGCVLEIAVSIAESESSFSAACAVVAAHARRCGLEYDHHAFDLRVTKPLDSSAVLQIHRENGKYYNAIGKSYPTGFEED
ncbi:MAG: hypothetical protein ACWA40_00640 [Planktomarina sp.]